MIKSGAQRFESTVDNETVAPFDFAEGKTLGEEKTERERGKLRCLRRFMLVVYCLRCRRRSDDFTVLHLKVRESGDEETDFYRRRNVKKANKGNWNRAALHLETIFSTQTEDEERQKCAQRESER